MQVNGKVWRDWKVSLWYVTPRLHLCCLNFLLSCSQAGQRNLYEGGWDKLKRMWMRRWPVQIPSSYFPLVVSHESEITELNYKIRSWREGYMAQGTWSLTSFGVIFCFATIAGPTGVLNFGSMWHLHNSDGEPNDSGWPPRAHTFWWARVHEGWVEEIQVICFSVQLEKVITCTMNICAASQNIEKLLFLSNFFFKL